MAARRHRRAQATVRLRRRLRRSAALPGDHGHAGRAARGPGPGEAAVGRHGAVHRQVAHVAGEVRHRAGRDARNGRVSSARRSTRAARRHAPTCSRELVHLRDGDDRLSEDELVATCILLLFAGHETTTNHIANGLLSLMQFPGEMRKLRDDPSLTNAAVEELLRYDGPSGAQVRIVQVEHQRHGKTLKAGRPGVHAAQRRQPRPARLCRARPARHRARRRCAPHLRLRRAHLPGLPAGAHGRPGGLPGGRCGVMRRSSRPRPRSSG